MKLYAIRHRSGNYLTDKYTGSSWWEGEAAPGFPRLFKTLGVARGWRTNWLKGRVVKTYSTSSYESFGYDECSLSYEPRPNRKPGDLEIIEVEVIFGEPI